MHQPHSVEMTGRLRLVLVGADGETKLDFETENLVLTQGKGVVADRMQPVPTQPAMLAMAIGDQSSVPADPSNITLQHEIARVALQSTNVAGAGITYGATFGAAVGTGAIQEAGVYGSLTTNGTPALTRSTFAVINKLAGDTLNISWIVTVN